MEEPDKQALLKLLGVRNGILVSNAALPTRWQGMGLLFFYGCVFGIGVSMWQYGFPAWWLSLGVTVAGFAGSLLGIYYLLRVDHLTLNLEKRQFVWEHGTHLRTQTVQGSLAEFSGLQLSQECRLRASFSQSPRGEVFWRLLLLWKDAAQEPLSLPFINVPVKYLSEETARKTTEKIAQILTIPLIKEVLLMPSRTQSLAVTRDA